MHRPAPPEDFGRLLKDAVSAGNPADRFGKLSALAQFDLNYVQTIQCDNALKRVRSALHDAIPQTRLAVLSSSTVEHLLPPLVTAGARGGVLLNVHATPYGQFRQELLSGDSALAEFKPEFVLFSLSARELIAGVALSASPEEVERYIAEYVADLASLWELAKSRFAATLIQQTFLNIGETLFGNFDRTVAAAPAQVIRRLNDALVRAAAASDVSILDLDRAVEKDGLNNWFDNGKWLQAKIEIPPAASTRYADLAVQIISAHQGRSKKCVVLDLDNTLWGGVIGDDGLENIALGEGTGLGEAFLSFQRYIKRLKECGVILAVCSKNEQATAESVFVEHPEMVLKLDDIACFVANWNDKASNLMHIAERLNIGIDSLVFVDDNPAERALVRQMLPAVAVPEMPADVADYVKCLSGAGYFEAVSFTREDMKRNEQYAANQQRERLQTGAQSLDEYLQSLQMRMTASPFQEVDLPRIAQLINKTNQFNTTTRRRTLDEVRAIFASRDYLTLQVRLSDRFGEIGLISALILASRPGADGVYAIDSWVMSCRVFGRQAEHEIMNALVGLAREAGVRRLLASYVPTRKNGLIENLYAELGFSPDAAAAPGTANETRWTLDLDSYSEHPTTIQSSAT